MSRGFVTSSKYSPGNMTPEALESTFVERHALMQEALKRIVKSTRSGEKHFMLLVGPRGMGKTHFVSLLFNKLTEEAEYAKARKKLCIAFLNEEESIASYLDLLVRVLNALTREPDGAPLKAQVEQIFSRYAENPDAAVPLAEMVLKEYAGKRTLLVICENFSTILDGLEREGQQRWRAFMQENPFWNVLATTTELTKDIKAHDAPFYGTFTIESLGKLSFEGALALLKQKAKVEGKSKIAELLDTPDGRARVRAIHHLADGNNRVYVVMFPFLNEESLNDIAPAFLEMVDEMTPYYQERMNRVAPVQRKILEYLSEKRIPTAVKDIALGCLSSPQTISKQVGELAHIGYVRGTRDGRETLYELNEPLMRICFEVKDRRSDYLKAFVDLLRGWYSRKELAERYAILGRDAMTDLLNRRHLEVAIKESENDTYSPFLSNLLLEAENVLRAGDIDKYISIYEAVVNEDTSSFASHMLAVAKILRDPTQDADDVLAGMAPDVRKRLGSSVYMLVEAVREPVFVAISAVRNEQVKALMESVFAKTIGTVNFPRLQLIVVPGLIVARRDKDAIKAADNALILGEDRDLVNRTFVCSAAISSDLPLAFDYIKHQKIVADELDVLVSYMAASVIALHGPLFFASQVKVLASLLGKLNAMSILNGLLIFIAQEKPSAGASSPYSLSIHGWKEAIPVIKEATKGIPECAMSMQLLEAAIRNAHGDPAALLKLPLEVRSLLEKGDDDPRSETTDTK